MAKVYDVPPDLLISRLSAILKSEDIPAPAWIHFVKTGAHATRPPHNRDWWHTRCASVLRKIYIHGPMGVQDLCKVYGGGKPSGYGAAHHKSAGGAIIRSAIHGLEKLGYVERLDKRGRIISKQGMQKIDRLATDILKELGSANPQLMIYA